MLDPATDVDFIAGTSISVANVSGCQYFSCQRLWLPIRPLPVSQAASTSVASVSGCQCLNCQCLSLQVSVASLYGCHYQLPVSLAASTSVASVSAGGYLICQCLGWLVPQLPVPLPQLLVSLDQLPVPLPQLLVPLDQLPVFRLVVPKLPVPLPLRPQSAGVCWCHGWYLGSVTWVPRISPSQLLRTVVICNTKNVKKI